MNLRVTLDWQGRLIPVGHLHVAVTRGQERYRFQYHPDWLAHPLRFDLDPALPLAQDVPYHSATLWGVFQDISPDRWGRLVMDRRFGHALSASEYMLGVSDTMRLGALRLSLESDPARFLAEHEEVPKLVQLRALEQAARNLERGQETPADLAMLAQPGSSLGGAHPKAVVEDAGVLWVAKFQPHTATERIGSWEALMHDLARQAGIRTAPFQILQAEGSRPIFLSQRFDRQGRARIPFCSAMTLLERDESSRDSASYLELSDAISRYSCQPRQDKHELWTRMSFNALAANTDDHLRNHGFLREPQGWRLAPAFDLNPNPEPYARRAHALSFDGRQVRPSLALCRELAPYFDVSDAQCEAILNTLARVLNQWQATARRYGLTAAEIQRYTAAFEHPDHPAAAI